MRMRGEFDALAQQGIDPFQREVLPRVVSAMFSTLMLAGLTCVVTAVLAYVSVYGFTTGAIPATRARLETCSIRQCR